MAEAACSAKARIASTRSDTTISHDLKRELTIGADDPLSARYRLTQTYELGREGWRIRIETETSMHASATHFFLSATLRAYENGALAGSRDMGRDNPARFAVTARAPFPFGG